MCRKANELDTTLLLPLARQQLSEYQSLYESLPTLVIQNMWINGSFGADAADESSDLDITVEVGVFDDEHEMDALYIADRITDLSGQFATVFNSHFDRLYCHGGYDTVYNVESQEYERI